MSAGGCVLYLDISLVLLTMLTCRGGFEVHRGEKLPNLCDGIQAHLSSCASSKVLEVVSKFPQRIRLKEVPRVGTWPAMFHESGAKEENIALYFFAKDFERLRDAYLFSK